MSSLIDVLLQDPDAGLRAVAASALGDLSADAGFHDQREAMVVALRFALQDPSREVQEAAVQALRRLDPADQRAR